MKYTERDFIGKHGIYNKSVKLKIIEHCIKSNNFTVVYIHCNTQLKNELPILDSQTVYSQMRDIFYTSDKLRYLNKCMYTKLYATQYIITLVYNSIIITIY